MGTFRQLRFAALLLISIGATVALGACGGSDDETKTPTSNVGATVQATATDMATATPSPKPTVTPSPKLMATPSPKPTATEAAPPDPADLQTFFMGLPADTRKQLGEAGWTKDRVDALITSQEVPSIEGLRSLFGPLATFEIPPLAPLVTGLMNSVPEALLGPAIEQIGETRFRALKTGDLIPTGADALAVFEIVLAGGDGQNKDSTSAPTEAKPEATSPPAAESAISAEQLKCLGRTLSQDRLQELAGEVAAGRLPNLSADELTAFFNCGVGF